MLAQAVERTFGRASAALSSSLSGRAMRADVFGKRAVDRLVQGHGDSRCLRHGRACPGHPRLSQSETWMRDTRPGMTESVH
jgi:hypothetical protein